MSAVRLQEDLADSIFPGTSGVMQDRVVLSGLRVDWRVPVIGDGLSSGSALVVGGAVHGAVTTFKQENEGMPWRLQWHPLAAQWGC